MANGRSYSIAVIGAGPAGLMAAEALSAGGASVTVYDRMPSIGRKLLMAGRGGLNLSHAEPFDRFVQRYGPAASRLEPALRAFSPSALIAWSEGLGQPVFIGSSGRIFPKAFKASPLLRAWLARLDGQGVDIRTRHDWVGWTTDGQLRFAAPDAEVFARADATVIALGGASWPRLGSNGAWTDLLAREGVTLSPLRPSNSGFLVGWSDLFRERFAGAPLKSVAMSFGGRQVRGEAMVTGYGLEGGAVYALSAELRAGVERDGRAALHIDLRPDMGADQIAQRLGRARKGESLSNHLRKAMHLSPLESNLLREAAGAHLPSDPAGLAKRIKDVRLTLAGVAPLERAISTAGGVAFSEVDEAYMLHRRPGVFVAGEMLDWEAPTGGYLLQACMATGRAAGEGALAWLRSR